MPDEGGASFFAQALSQASIAFCLSDPWQPDCPIVFANEAFGVLTGYAASEVIGHNCRFLQGPATDQREVEKVRVALRERSVLMVELLNYRKDGTAFWNALHLGPIYGADGELLYFFGSQWDVSKVRAARAEERHAKVMARELSHRMKNVFAVITGIVNISGRMRGIPREAEEINSRIQALGRAYETTLDEAASGSIELGPAIHAILASHSGEANRLALAGGRMSVPFATISVVGLVLHELADNATRFGAWSNDRGNVAIAWEEAEDEGRRSLVLRWHETGGPSILAPPEVIGTGTQIVDRMLRHGGGTIERNWTADGLDVTILIRL